MIDHQLQRAQLLIDHDKYAEAEKAIKEILSQEPNHVFALAMLAEVYLQQDKLDTASSIIDNAIGLNPDFSPLFYLKARVQISQNKVDAGMESLKQAIALNPDNADYFALAATVKLEQKAFEEALELANKALELDAENLLALNTRSSALLKLGRKAESFDTIQGALRENPNSAYTHANFGWGLLEKGDYKQAQEHFKESLKNDPNNEFAQSGMLEAIKAQNPIFRLYLKYAFWIGNLTKNNKWAVILGFYFGVKILRSIAKNVEGLRPWLLPIIVILGLMAFSTWIINPISNLFLRFNKYGKYLLSAKEKISSNFVAASFLIFLLGLILVFTTGDPKSILLIIFGITMMVPLSAMFAETRTKNLLLIYTIALAILGIGGIGLAYLTDNLSNILGIIYLVGFIAFQWVANYVRIER